MTSKLFLANESLVLVDCASVIAWAAYSPCIYYWVCPDVEPSSDG